MPGDDPLAALDVIAQRCRELSAKCHLEPTSATDPMTDPKQRAARVEARKSRDDDDRSHVFQVTEIECSQLPLTLYKHIVG